MTNTLANACRTAIQHGNALSDINPAKWAETYNCMSEEIRIAWEAELTRISRVPDNMYQEGK